MLLCDSRKFLFVHIPKTAGQSVHAALHSSPNVTVLPEHRPTPMKGAWNYDHAKAYRIREYLGDRWEDYFRFAFMRNPWDWLVSLFSYARQSSALENSREPETVRWSQRMREFKNFKEFALCEPMLPEPQHLWITEPHDAKQIIVDQVFYFERLREDFDFLKKRIGVDGKLPHIEPSVHAHYSKYYDDELAEKIGQRYQIDIDLLGYEFVDCR